MASCQEIFCHRMKRHLWVASEIKSKKYAFRGIMVPSHHFHDVTDEKNEIKFGKIKCHRTTLES